MRFRRIWSRRRLHGSTFQFQNLSLHSHCLSFSFELHSCIPIVFPFTLDSTLAFPLCFLLPRSNLNLHSHCLSFYFELHSRQSQQTALLWQRELSTYEVLDIDVYHIRYYISTPTSTVTYIGGSTQVDYKDPSDIVCWWIGGKNSYK